MTLRRVVASLQGPGQSPVLPVGSLLSVGRCGRCSCFPPSPPPPRKPILHYPKRDTCRTTALVSAAACLRGASSTATAWGVPRGGGSQRRRVGARAVHSVPSALSATGPAAYGSGGRGRNGAIAGVAVGSEARGAASPIPRPRGARCAAGGRRRTRCFAGRVVVATPPPPQLMNDAA